ncbi:MAG: NADAR family protein [Methanosphaera stadtmanae]|nr:NADAR family protein [Methanosphaera stadtmanae]
MVISMTIREGKYIAPPWIKYPTYPEQSLFWKSGSGAEYLLKFKENVKNEEEYLKIFPKAPTFTKELTPSESLSQEVKDFLGSSSKPLLIRLWKEDAKPKYEFDINEREDIIFMFDKLFYDDSKHFHIGTKGYSSANEIVELVESELRKESSQLWDELKYTVILNAIYYKFVSDINFTKEVIKTKDNVIVYKSNNLELGVQETDDGKYVGNNLLGLATMELRDVLKEVYANYDDIDWELSGDPDSEEHCMCGHVHY